MPSAFIAASFAAKRAANEDAPEEAFAVAVDHVRNALDFGRIETDTYN